MATRLEELKLERLKREKARRGRIPGITGPIFGQGLATEQLKETAGAIRRGVSTAGFGIPEFAVGKFAPELKERIFPEQITGPGKAIRFGAEAAGLFGGGAAGAAKFVGGLIPKVAGGIGLGGQIPRIISARKRAIALRNALRGAAEAGTFGATQITDIPGTEEGVTLGGQAKQAGVGATLGLAFGAFAPGIRGAARAFKKFRTPTKTPSIRVVTERVKLTGKEVIEKIKIDREQALARINKQIPSVRAESKEALQLESKFAKEVLNETTDTLKNNVQVLNEQLQSTSEVASRTFQTKLPKFYRENSKAYGRVLDDITDDLIKKGDDITIAETDEILTNVIRDMDESLITEGAPRKAIESLQQKYSVKFTGQGSKFFRGSTGQPVGGAIKTNAEDAIPFKNLVSDLKTVKKSLSAGAKTGATRFTQEDVAISLLDKNLGEFLKGRVPEFQKLQSEYAPVIRAMKTSNRLFKPFKGEFETKTGTQLIKRLAKGETEAGEEALIRTIEQGTRFGKGIGRIAEAPGRVGEQLATAKQRINPILRQVRSENLLKQQGVDKKFAQQLQDLTRKKEFISADFTQKEIFIKEELSERLRELGQREDVISNLLKDKAKTGQVLRILLRVGFAAGAVGGILGIRRFGRFNEPGG